MQHLLSILLAGCVLLGGRPAPAQGVNLTPTISEIPAPIIGSAEYVTGGGVFAKFVYPDALDLGNLASDDLTSPSALRWSYAIMGETNYRINGVLPIDLAATDPLDPPLGFQINKRVAKGELNPDGRAQTITIRNQGLSPLGGGTITPGTTGIIPAETRVVTFFCSDGNSYTSSSVFFYTDNGGYDRLSGTDPFRVVKSDKITTMWATSPTDWAPGGANGTTRTLGAGGTGVCLSVPLAGDNYGAVITAFPYFNLAANQVYRIRMKMTCSNLTPGNMPFWDIVLENYEPFTGKGLNLYIMDVRVFPNEGAANALTPTVSTFTWYWTPPAVATPQWNNAGSGAFTAVRDAVNDPRLRFRVMDYSTAVYPVGQGDLKSGALCLQEVEVASTEVMRAQAVQNLVNITSLAPNTGTGGNIEFVPLFAGCSTGVFASGALTITPVDGPGDDSRSTDGRVVEMPEIHPATDATFSMDPKNPMSQDNFPIAWKTGKILRLQVGLSAPTAADEANPWDASVFLFNTMTNEINMESYQTSNKGIGSPKVGAPQTYTTFFYTGAETKSLVAGYHRLRWLMRFINIDYANFPNGQLTNTGSTTIHNIKVDEVVFR